MGSGVSGSAGLWLKIMDSGCEMPDTVFFLYPKFEIPNPKLKNPER